VKAEDRRERDGLQQIHNKDSSCRCGDARRRRGGRGLRRLTFEDYFRAATEPLPASSGCGLGSRLRRGGLRKPKLTRGLSVRLHRGGGAMSGCCLPTPGGGALRGSWRPHSGWLQLSPGVQAMFGALLAARVCGAGGRPPRPVPAMRRGGGQ